MISSYRKARLAAVSTAIITLSAGFAPFASAKTVTETRVDAYAGKALGEFSKYTNIYADTPAKTLQGYVRAFPLKKTTIYADADCPEGTPDGDYKATGNPVIEYTYDKQTTNFGETAEWDPAGTTDVVVNGEEVFDVKEQRAKAAELNQNRDKVIIKYEFRNAYFRTTKDLTGYLTGHDYRTGSIATAADWLAGDSVTVCEWVKKNEESSSSVSFSSSSETSSSVSSEMSSASSSEPSLSSSSEASSEMSSVSSVDTSSSSSSESSMSYGSSSEMASSSSASSVEMSSSSSTEFSSSSEMSSLSSIDTFSSSSLSNGGLIIYGILQ